MKTKGQFEASIGNMLVQFVHGMNGRGPQTLRVFSTEELIVCRMTDGLTTMEKSALAGSGTGPAADLIAQTRRYLFINSTAQFARWFADNGHELAGLHHDIKLPSGDEVVIFFLSEVPEFTPQKERNDGEERKAGQAGQGQAGRHDVGREAAEDQVCRPVGA